MNPYGLILVFFSHVGPCGPTWAVQGSPWMTRGLSRMLPNYELHMLSKLRRRGTYPYVLEVHSPECLSVLRAYVARPKHDPASDIRVPPTLPPLAG